MVLARIFVLLLVMVLAGGAAAQATKRIEKAADLPRFSYKIDTKLEDMVRDDCRACRQCRLTTRAW